MYFPLLAALAVMAALGIPAVADRLTTQSPHPARSTRPAPRTVLAHWRHGDLAPGAIPAPGVAVLPLTGPGTATR